MIPSIVFFVLCCDRNIGTSSGSKVGAFGSVLVGLWFVFCLCCVSLRWVLARSLCEVA